MAPKLYYFSGSPTVRAVMVTAKLLGIEFELHELDFLKKEHLSPAYLKINPQHTVPTLDDNGNILWDNHAISAYLVRKYGKNDSLYPKDLYKRAVVDQRLHFESGVLYPLLRKVDGGLLTKEITEVPSRYIQEINEAYGFLEKFLEGHHWIAGDTVTIADFSVATTTMCLDYHVKIDAKNYPSLTGWMKRIKELPCFASDCKQMEYFTSYFEDLKRKK